ncbi:hypothetical protein [Vibrio palustris]|uniref:Bacterial Ig-like domain (Group 1) n=1 Tax=Vibrio palustris TaxID=1918946 RepID=A0A1R4B5Y2_9VIBR|nr:hypothetical protein [Vibrio palustris]SJL84327.1 hypothetical protein VPAL9027_02309 [Vibrio palustris]
MKFILTVLTTAALFISATASAAQASDISIDVTSHANQANITVTEGGKPLKDYPFSVKGLMVKENKTGQDGSVTIYNNDSTSKTVTFIVKDENGEEVKSNIFLGYNE